MKRTLLIGLDGMSFTLLDHFIETGLMPFLKRFVDNGVRAELISTPCPVTPPAWTSIMTGRSPGHHGIFDFIRVDEDCTDRLPFRLTNARDVLCETIWSIAGRQGRVVGSLNFPQMFLARPFNGYMVPGFVTARALRTSVQPREFWNRIKELPDFNVKDVAWDLEEGRKPLGSGLEKDGYKDWIGYLMRKEKGWFAVARELLVGTPCDLVAVVFEGIDRLQHQTWRLLDPTLMPGNPTPWEEEIRGYCLDYFHELDVFVRELVELAGDEAQVFMVSDHGFGVTTEVFYANVWLERRGYLKWKEGVRFDDQGSLTADNMREHFDTIDWNRTIAYARTTSANGIYIRVAREPGQPGISPESYKSFRSELSQALLSFKDPRTGMPVVTEVLTREEAFPGRATAQAPDLTVTLRDGGFISILKANNVLKPRPEVRGTHRREGIFLAGGHHVRKEFSLSPRSVLDVAPTILYSEGLPVPEDFEGEVVTEAFEPSLLECNPVQIGKPTLPPDEAPVQGTGGLLKSSEEAQILEKLKTLGYFE